MDVGRMENNLTARATITINVPPATVWEALTMPAIIKQYLFGADVITDWQVGGIILYRGQWEGKPYEDKGRILRVETEKLLVSTHWSPLSGTADSPENYHTGAYELSDAGGNSTRLTITQDGNGSEDEKAHSQKNWQMVPAAMKALLEK